jgi:hypothetical protein
MIEPEQTRSRTGKCSPRSIPCRIMLHVLSKTPLSRYYRYSLSQRLSHCPVMCLSMGWSHTGPTQVAERGMRDHIEGASWRNASATINDCRPMHSTSCGLGRPSSSQLSARGRTRIARLKGRHTHAAQALFYRMEDHFPGLIPAGASLSMVSPRQDEEDIAGLMLVVGRGY